MQWIKAKEYILQGYLGKLPEWTGNEVISFCLNKSNTLDCKEPNEEDKQRLDWEVYLIQYQLDLKTQELESKLIEKLT